MPQVCSTRPWTQSGLSPKWMRLMVVRPAVALPTQPPDLPVLPNGHRVWEQRQPRVEGMTRELQGLVSHLREETTGRERVTDRPGKQTPRASRPGALQP